MAGRFRKTRHAIAYILTKLFISVVLIIPRPIMLRIAIAVGYLFELLLVPMRREVLKNLDFIFGDSKTPAEKKKLCRGIFINLGITACDSIQVPGLSPEKFRTIVHADVSAVTKALETHGVGAVGVGGHLSSFEVQSHIFGIEKVPFVTIGAELFDKRVDAEVTKLRSRNGIRYLPRNGSGRRLLKELKENRLFASLLDQDATNDGVFARFLGHLAYTPSGPLRIAVRLKLPLFFFGFERHSDYTYTFTVEGPIDLPDVESDDEKVAILAQKYNDFISAQILKCPEQWVWMHRRWKRKREDFPETVSITDFE